MDVPNAEHIAPEVRDRCARALATLHAQHDAVVGSVVSTADGYIVADRLPDGWKKGDVAAMASTVAGLASTIASRTEMGGNDNVVIENEKGKIIVRRINEFLTLTTVGKLAASLGMQLSAGRSCVQSLEDLALDQAGNRPTRK